MDVADLDWRSKMVSIRTDSERTMIGRIFGVQMRFKGAEDIPIAQIWCGLQQLHFVAHE